MTPVERRAFDFIEAHWQSYGYSPSFREISRALHLNSLSGVHRIVHQLCREGWISMPPDGRRRIEIARHPTLHPGVQKMVDGDLFGHAE